MDSALGALVGGGCECASPQATWPSAAAKPMTVRHILFFTLLQACETALGYINPPRSKTFAGAWSPPRQIMHQGVDPGRSTRTLTRRLPNVLARRQSGMRRSILRPFTAPPSSVTV